MFSHTIFLLRQAMGVLVHALLGGKASYNVVCGHSVRAQGVSIYVLLRAWGGVSDKCSDGVQGLLIHVLQTAKGSQ